MVLHAWTFHVRLDQQNLSKHSVVPSNEAHLILRGFKGILTIERVSLLFLIFCEEKHWDSPSSEHKGEEHLGSSGSWENLRECETEKKREQQQEFISGNQHGWELLLALLDRKHRF